jgi:hypothetical protein
MRTTKKAITAYGTIRRQKNAAPVCFPGSVRADR